MTGQDQHGSGGTAAKEEAYAAVRRYLAGRPVVIPAGFRDQIAGDGPPMLFPDGCEES